MQTKDIKDFTVEFRIRDAFNPKEIIVNQSNTIQCLSSLLASKGIVNSPELFPIHLKSSCCLSEQLVLCQTCPIYIAISGVLCQGTLHITQKY